MEEQLMAMNKTFSLTVGHVGMILELTRRLERSQADILKEAIEDIYRKYPKNGDPVVVAGEASDGG
jgi:hypothetical protein